MVQQHPPMHPVSLCRRGIQVSTPAKGGLGQVGQTRIMIDVAQILPSHYRVGGEPYGFAQDSQGIRVLAPLTVHGSERQGRLEGFRVQAYCFAGRLLRQGEVARPVFLEIARFQRIRLCQQRIRIHKGRIFLDRAPGRALGVLQCLALGVYKVVCPVGTSLQ